jgi:predicted dehydrogenase
MSDKIRLAIIGTGNCFRLFHSKELLGHPEIDIVAYCDVDEAKAKSWADENGGDWCTDYREIIKRDDVDAVDIVTPNLYHSEIAVAALEAGKDVFCEKPDAISVAEAQKMADAAAKSGKLLMTMRNNRFRPASQFVKKFIEDGSMGEVYTGRCGWVRRRGIPGRGGWFTTKALSGGGPLIDLGVHFIDLAVWLMGNPKPVSVTGATYQKFAKNDAKADSQHAAFGEAKEEGTIDVEDLATGFIRFDNGATLQIEFSWASNVPEERNFLELRGTKAGFVMSGRDEPMLPTEINGTLVDLMPKLGKGKVDIHGKHLHHFIDCLKGRSKPINNPTDGVNMIKILMAIYESAKTGSEVKL